MMLLTLTCTDDDGVEHVTTMGHQPAVDLAYIVGALTEGRNNGPNLAAIAAHFDVLPLGGETCSREVAPLCDQLEWLRGMPR